MRKSTGLLLSLIASIVVYSQMTIQPGAGMHTTNQARLVVNNIDLINNDSQSDFSNAVIVVTGNSNSWLGGTGNWLVRSLIIDKPGAMVTLESPLQITDSIKMQQGLLHLNNQVITLGASSTIEGENENSRIVGPSGGYIEITLPLNAPANINAGKLGAVISSPFNLGPVTIRRGHEQQIPSQAGSSILRYYEIASASNENINATLRFHYLDAELNGLPEAGLDLYGRAGNTWQLIGASGRNASNNYMEKTGITSLQSYTLALPGALPLLWGDLYAGCNNQQILVKWETLQEQNTSHFIVQRSHGNQAWSDVGIRPAAGHSDSKQAYSFYDTNVPSGIHTLSYQIVAVDQDGSKRVSKVMQVQNCKEPPMIALYPIPVNTQATLSVYSSIAYKTSVNITGADGRLWKTYVRDLKTGVNQFAFDLGYLTPGIYYLSLNNGKDEKAVISFIKQ